ncbi:MAG: delta(1)-pyrroline-2-carboxylate reductase family protein [Thermodesulfobacteriota bacterium]
MLREEGQGVLDGLVRADSQASGEADCATNRCGQPLAKRQEGKALERFAWLDLLRLGAYENLERGYALHFEYRQGRLPVSALFDHPDDGRSRVFFGYDQAGTLRVVTDENGETIKAIDCDSFGRVLEDTWGWFFVPVGFAVGCRDRRTGFVRFGRRDYDPEVGRCNARDPLGGAGGDHGFLGLRQDCEPAREARMQVMDAERTRALLPYAGLAEALAGALRRWKAGEVAAPPRQRVALPDGGVLLVMPAAGERLAVAKLVSVHPDNPGRGLPLIRGEVAVLDARSGERLALLDGPELTARRTAALSLLAARTLAPDPAGPLLVVGAGVQARGHLEAFRQGLGTERAWVADLSRDKAEALAAHGRGLGMDCSAVARPDDVLPEAALVVTATTSAAPVLPPASPGDGLRPDCFIAAVGAHSPGEAEIPAALVRRCRVYVDMPEACAAEAGDLIQARVDWSRVTPLADALDLPRPAGDAAGPVLFKTVGHALFDLAAAELAAGGRGVDRGPHAIRT